MLLFLQIWASVLREVGLMDEIKTYHVSTLRAPTRLDMVKINPTMGMLSRRAAAKPNTEKPRRHE